MPSSLVTRDSYPVPETPSPASNVVSARFDRTTTSTVQPVAHQEPEPVPVPATAEAPKSDWTLEDVEQIALNNNPAIAEAAAHVDAAHGNWIQVGLPPNLTVGYSGQQLGSRGLAEQQGVYINQEIVTGRKLRLSRQVAAWQLEQAQHQLSAKRFQVLTDVRIAYYDVLIAQRRKETTERLVQINEQGVRAADALFRGKEVSEADPLRAKIEADMARIASVNAENQLMGAWRTLAAAIGIPGVEPSRLTGELSPEQMIGTWEEILGQILAESPELAASYANVEAAHWAVHRARAAVIPNIDVQGIVQQDNATNSSNGALQVAVPLPLLNRNQGGIREAIAKLSAAELAVTRLELDLQTRCANAYQRYQNARNQVERYTAKGGILENAEKTMELIRVGYNAGEFAVLDLLTSERTYFQTNLAYLESLRELWSAAMEIRGLLLKGGLASP